MTLMMNKEAAVLHGAFLRADQLCLPSSLSSLQKADWSKVGRPILEAVREICGQSEQPNTSSVRWIKRVVCAVWLKLLSRETGEDIEVSWRESPFFLLQNGLPEVNHVVLLEVVKSLAAARAFAHFLLHLPQPQICSELDRLVQHVRSSLTTEEDVAFFLEVWWELWKGLDKQKAGGEETIEMMFARQFARVSSQSPSPTQAAKRLKLDMSQSSSSSATPDVLHILLHGLKDIKDHILTKDLCLQALSISLDTFYTAFLINEAIKLPIEEKMLILSQVVSVCEESGGKLSPELICEAQRDHHASHAPSQFQSSRMNFSEALKIITEMAQFWNNSGLLEVAHHSYSSLKLQQSVQRILKALKEEVVQESRMEKDTLISLLESLSFPAVEISPEVRVKVASVIITHRLDGYQSFASLYADEESWAVCGESWPDCVKNNQAAFQQSDTLTKLTSTFMSKLRQQSMDVTQCRKMMKVITDIFSALSLQDKNEALASMLRVSSRGFFGCPVPPAVTDGFEQELNMAFNCIIQGGAGASAAASQANLNTAVSLVARVMFQNPEAALRSCCQSAVFNKGAHSLMANILQQLPGLRGQRAGGDADGGGSLLCQCLQDVMKSKSLSASEEEQFLKFLSLLMMAVIEVEGEERRESFLPPQEVVNTFVLPHLSSTAGQGSSETELSLQLLHTALSVQVQDPTSAPHWVLDCSPFPLLFVLAQLYNNTLSCWEQPPGGAVHHLSMDSRELLVSVLTTLGQVVGEEVAAAPSSWSRALFWLYNKMEDLDWTVRFHLKPVWGEHFKNEAPSALLTVCDLPEQEWSALDLPQYSQGTGLLAWMECCSISDSLQSTMLSHLSLDQRRSDHVGMFSKGLLVALTQTLPWCLPSQWTRLLRALRELIASGRLHVPFSLEYVDYLPLLDLRRFLCELRLSVLLLRVLQLLCGSSCSDWLSADGWAHVGRLYAYAVREVMNSIRAKLPVPSSAAPTVSAATPVRAKTARKGSSSTSPQISKDSPLQSKEAQMMEEEEKEKEEKEETAPSQEVLFVLSQLFCHVQHIQVMMPGGQSEPLFLSCLEILSYYETVMAAFPHSCSALESDNTRHFFTTITDNLQNQEMKAVLQQKIAQLVSAA